MRGSDTFTESLFTMRRLDEFVPPTHPLRPVREMVNVALKNIEPLLSGMYAADIKGGRPSIAPEKLLRAMLLRRMASRGGEPGGCLFQSVTSALEFEHRAPVHEPIEDGGAHGVIAQVFAPILNDAV